MTNANNVGRTILLLATSLSLLLAAGCKQQSELTPAASLDSRLATGVAVSGDGRVFVNFPRWSHSHDLSVAEIDPNGIIRPYPSAQWNFWSPGDDPRKRFVCVQSITTDPQAPDEALWVLDSGNPRFEGVVPNAPKLVQVDLAGGRVVRTIRFSPQIAPRDSYLNDVRVDMQRGFAYITDSGRGALVVVNLNTNRARRVLDGHVSTRADADVKPVIGGRALRNAQGLTPQIHANGIALSPQKDMLYFKSLTGRTLYRIETVKLRNFSLPDSKLILAVESLGKTVVSDGMIFGRDGKLYLTALEQNAIVSRSADGKLKTLVADPRLAWPDSVAIAPNGDLYITVSQIHRMAKFNEGQSRRRLPYTLYKLPAVAPPDPERAPKQEDMLKQILPQ